MLNHTTVNQLKGLKLAGMAEALAQQLDQPQIFELAFEDRLALLVDREISHRESRRLTRLLQLARLRTPAAVEDVDSRPGRGLSREGSAACPPASGSGAATISSSPDPPAAARPTSLVRWASRLVVRGCRPAMSASRACLRRSASPMATAAMRS